MPTPRMLLLTAFGLVLMAPALAAPDPPATSLLAVQAQTMQGRLAAIRAIGEAEVGNPEAAPVLAPLLADEYWDVRKATAVALAHIGPVALPVLMRAVQGQNYWQRMHGAESLGLMGPPAKSAAPALVALMDDRDDDVAMWATWALGRIAPDPQIAVPALTKKVISGQGMVASVAASGLGRLGVAATPAVPKLIAAMETAADGDAIATALAGIGPAAVGELSKKLSQPGVSKPQQWKLIQALGMMGAAAKPAVPVLIPHVEKPVDQWFAALTADALGAIGPDAAAAVPALMNAGLKHGYADMRRASAEALGKIGPAAKVAVPALANIARNDPDDAVRATAQAAVERLQ